MMLGMWGFLLNISKESVDVEFDFKIYSIRHHRGYINYGQLSFVKVDK